MERKPRKIGLESDEAQLARDLQKYQDKALELGATKVKIVRADEIPVDERVTLKCQIPRCFGYGAGANCPPNALKPAELRELLQKYKRALFFVKEVPSNIIVRDKATIKERVAAYQERPQDRDGNRIDGLLRRVLSCVWLGCRLLPTHILRLGRGLRCTEGRKVPVSPARQAVNGSGRHQRLQADRVSRMDHLSHRERR